MSFPSASSRVGGQSGRFSTLDICMSACLDCGTPLPTQLLELARADLIFITDRPLRFGTSVQLSLYSDFVSAVTQNRATIHWCRPHTQGWQIGAFLNQPLPDRLTENQWNDLRGSLRYDCNWKAWVLWEQNGQLDSVKVVNYSISGIRMLASHPIVANQPFSLFGSAGSRERAVLNGQVQWCRPIEDQFQVAGLIHGQRGRELPRMFGNLTAVHVEKNACDAEGDRESHNTRRCEQDMEERFLPVGRATPRRTFHGEETMELLES